MPAFARVVIPEIPYHVTQRGNYRQDVFFAAKDPAVYLNYLTTAAQQYGLELHGWCLMSNHVHWIVVPLSPGAMAQTFRRAHSRYATYVNRRHKQRSGHLWQGRYYSCPLGDGHYGAALLYVERNPMRGIGKVGGRASLVECGGTAGGEPASELFAAGPVGPQLHHG